MYRDIQLSTPSIDPLRAKPIVDDSKRIVCLNETGNCPFICSGASVIIALEPICYSLQKCVNINPVSHCDYIVVLIDRLSNEIVALLVEIDPPFRHRDPKELQDKLDHCEEVLNAFVRTLTSISITSRTPYSPCKVKRVLLVSYEAMKSRELRELIRKRVIDHVDVCWSSVESWVKK